MREKGTLKSLKALEGKDVLDVSRQEPLKSWPRVLTAYLSLQRQTPLQGQEVEARWVGVKGGHACFLELEGALVNLTCACQVASVVSDSLGPYGLQPG